MSRNSLVRRGGPFAPIGELVRRPAARPTGGIATPVAQEAVASCRTALRLDEAHAAIAGGSTSLMKTEARNFRRRLQGLPGAAYIPVAARTSIPTMPNEAM